MEIFKRAKENAMLNVENAYVFNDIYFGDEGLTSASANHVSAMATVMASDMLAEMNGLRMYEKRMRIMGYEDEVVVEAENNTLEAIMQNIGMVCKANSLAAWLREAVKERESAQKYVRDLSFTQWASQEGIDIPNPPTAPVSPCINFEDRKTILDAGISIKEYNRYIELNSTLAVYGMFIHDKGILTNEKKNLQRLAKNPTVVKGEGRDTTITTYRVDANASTAIDSVYAELQSQYRKLQAEKNGIESKWNNLAETYQSKRLEEHQAAIAAYKQRMLDYSAESQILLNRMSEWKKERLDYLASLKIIIPNDLVSVYEKLKEKYL